MDWYTQLHDLLGGLGQSPLEDIGGLMDITGTDSENEKWMAVLDASLAACVAGDRRVIDAINAGSGFAISTTRDAAEILRETRSIYMEERNP